MWQSWARWTYDMMKQLLPTVVRNDWVVPRLIVVYSRIVVPSPISTVVCSPRNFRSWGSPPSTVPVPTFTLAARITLRSSVARGAITQPSPIVHPSPMIANGPISTSAPIVASGLTMAVG